MGCAACEELLMAYLDGELSDAERAAVDGHLAGCEHCRQVLDELASLAGVLRNVYGARAISEDSKARTSSAISAADRRTGADDAARAHLRIGGFEILSRLGEGGMGSVYKARQVTMDRIVALKILRPDLARDAEFVKRFSREARASAKLNHPNIMQGIDVGQDGEHHYFAMEYLEGLTVSRIVRKEGHMDQKRALRVVKQVACGLEHAWKHGIIHRDIKPENIMITARSEVKLCDLGLAKRTDPDASITQTGTIVGTPHYVSPEQARGAIRLDTRSDIYALGATLYYMLTGQEPFDGDTAAIVMAKHIDEPVPDPRTLNPEVSPAAVALIERMMAKSPAGRPADPTELISEIDRVLSGKMPARTVPPRPAGVPTRRRSREMTAPRRSSGTPFYIALVAAAAMLLVAAAIFLSTGPQDPGPPKRASAPEQREPGTQGPRVTSPKAPDPLRHIAEALEYAKNQAQASPGNYAANARRYEIIVADAAGTRFEAVARKELARMVADRQRQADKLAAAACAEAERAYGAGEIAKAFSLLRTEILPPELSGADIAATIDAKRAGFARAQERRLASAESSLKAIRSDRLLKMNPSDIAARLEVPGGVPELLLLSQHSADVLDEVLKVRDKAILNEKRLAERAERRRFDAAFGKIRALARGRDLVNAMAACKSAIDSFHIPALTIRLASQKQALELATEALEAARTELKRLEDAGERKTVILENGSRMNGMIRDVTDASFTVKSHLGITEVKIADLSIQTLLPLAEAGLGKKEGVDLKLASLKLAVGDIGGAKIGFARSGRNAIAKELLEFTEFSEKHELLSLVSRLNASSIDSADEGRISLTYDFDRADQMKEWHTVEGFGDPKWRIVRGALTGGGGGVTFAPTLKQNLAVEIECVLERGEALAILFDRTERDNFYALVIGYNGRAYFEKWTNGRPSLLGNPIEDVRVKGPLKVALTRQGGKLTAAIGGRTIAAEARPGSGALGLFAPSGELAVDKVRITAELDAAWLRKNLGAEAR